MRDDLGYYGQAAKVVLTVGLLVLCYTAMFRTPVQPGSVASFELQPLTVALLGFAIGCYGTVVGIGGGPLVMSVLIVFYGWESEHLVATSLLIVFLNALSGTIGYARQKRIDYRSGVRFSLAALPGAMMMGYIHHLLNIKAFNVIFGVFLLFLAVYSLLGVHATQARATQAKAARTARRRRPWPRHARLVDRFGTEFQYDSNDTLGMGLNVVLGFFSGFMGIGGGIFQVPLLAFLLSYPVHIATATSHFITMNVAFFGLVPHCYLGNILFHEAMWMGLWVFLGAQVGAYIAPKINGRFIIYLFVVVVVFLAFEMIVR